MAFFLRLARDRTTSFTLLPQRRLFSKFRPTPGFGQVPEKPGQVHQSQSDDEDDDENDDEGGGDNNDKPSTPFDKEKPFGWLGFHGDMEAVDEATGEAEWLTAWNVLAKKGTKEERYALEDAELLAAQENEDEEEEYVDPNNEQAMLEKKRRLQRKESILRRQKKQISQIPIIRVAEHDALGRAYGTGRRKTSVARVWLYPFKGFQAEISVNGKHMADYFHRDAHKLDILAPFKVTSTLGTYTMFCTVKGGGMSGQAGAVRHGIARALEKYDPNYRPELKKAGFMTRDPRMVESKKIGRTKARKGHQWVKR